MHSFFSLSSIAVEKSSANANPLLLFGPTLWKLVITSFCFAPSMKLNSDVPWCGVFVYFYVVLGICRYLEVLVIYNLHFLGSWYVGWGGEHRS